MNIDFHTHGKLTKGFNFSKEYTKHLFKSAREAGLDAICLTEHFNTIEFMDLYRFVEETGEKTGDSYNISGLRVFTGVEVDIKEGGHILVIGNMDDIKYLNSELTPFMSKSNFIPIRSLFDLVEKRNMIIGAAHPFREKSNIPEFDNDILSKFDFFDLNGKDFAEFGSLGQEKLRNLSNKFNIPVVAGSDTHQHFQYGAVYNIFGGNITTITELKNAIKTGAYTTFISEICKLKVEHAVQLKKALKYIHSLGGDYSQVLGLEETICDEATLVDTFL
jgi:predicted metal-dependent phosphoesterase TrpH